MPDWAPIQWLGIVVLVAICLYVFFDVRPWRALERWLERREARERPFDVADVADVTWRAPEDVKWQMAMDEDGNVYSYNPERDTWEVVS